MIRDLTRARFLSNRLATHLLQVHLRRQSRGEKLKPWSKDEQADGVPHAGHTLAFDCELSDRPTVLCGVNPVDATNAILAEDRAGISLLATNSPTKAQLYLGGQVESSIPPNPVTWFSVCSDR
jgi:hypothetical protein